MEVGLGVSAVDIGCNSKNRHVFTEEDWSKVELLTSSYAKSKVIAEQALWDLRKQSGWFSFVCVYFFFCLENES